MVEKSAESRRKNLLFVVPSLNLAGAQKVVVELIRGLDRSRYNPLVCCLLGLGHFEQELRRLDVEVLVLPLSRSFDLRFPLRMARLLRRRNIDLVSVHYHWFDFWVTVSAALVGVPCQVTKHSTYRHAGAQRLAVAMMERATLRLADSYVAVSQGVADHLAKVYGARRESVRVVYNGMDLAPLEPDRDTREAARRELGFQDHQALIGTVGNLHRLKKGYEQLIEVVPEVLRHCRDAHFLWIGGDVDGLQGELAARALELGVSAHVHLLGRRSDVPRLLQAMDLFVLPSVLEGLGYALIEAMATGLPVVATNVGGVPEVVCDGETGILIPPGEPGTLATAIVKMTHDPECARAMGQAGRERARQKFTRERMVEEYQEIFESAL